jgi:DDE superfamily endonuclease
MRRTWGPRGRTPVICHRFKWKRASMAAGLCYGLRGGGAQLAFHHQLGAYDTDTLIGALEGLRRFLGGQQATLLWDGLPAHRRHAMRAWLRRQRSWLVVEPLPAYTPELNPVQPLWGQPQGGWSWPTWPTSASRRSLWRPRVAASGSAAPTNCLLVPAALRPVPLVSAVVPSGRCGGREIGPAGDLRWPRSAVDADPAQPAGGPPDGVSSVGLLQRQRSGQSPPGEGWTRSQTRRGTCCLPASSRGLALRVSRSPASSTVRC